MPHVNTFAVLSLWLRFLLAFVFAFIVVLPDACHGFSTAVTMLHNIAQFPQEDTISESPIEYSTITNEDLITPNVVELHWGSGSAILDPRHSPTTVRIGDIVEIVCPFNYHIDTTPPDKLEYFKIYMVTREGYDRCIVNDSTSQELGSCITPFDPNIIRFQVRSLLPEPDPLDPEPSSNHEDVLRFKEGQYYYFIATSTGKYEGLHAKRGGLCKTKNHRLSIFVDDVYPPLTARPPLAPIDLGTARQLGPDLSSPFEVLNHHGGNGPPFYGRLFNPPLSDEPHHPYTTNSAEQHQQVSSEVGYKIARASLRKATAHPDGSSITGTGFSSSDKPGISGIDRLDDLSSAQSDTLKQRALAGVYCFIVSVGLLGNLVVLFLVFKHLRFYRSFLNFPHTLSLHLLGLGLIDSLVLLRLLMSIVEFAFGYWPLGLAACYYHWLVKDLHIITAPYLLLALTFALHKQLHSNNNKHRLTTPLLIWNGLPMTLLIVVICILIGWLLSIPQISSGVKLSRDTTSGEGRVTAALLLLKCTREPRDKLRQLLYFEFYPLLAGYAITLTVQGYLSLSLFRHMKSQRLRTGKPHDMWRIMKRVLILTALHYVYFGVHWLLVLMVLTGKFLPKQEEDYILLYTPYFYLAIVPFLYFSVLRRLRHYGEVPETSSTQPLRLLNSYSNGSAPPAESTSLVSLNFEGAGYSDIGSPTSNQWQEKFTFP